jgi:hypothetical protein
MAFLEIKPPHALSLGKELLSIIRVLNPFFDRFSAQNEPEGPAPITAASYLNFFTS